MEKEIYDVIIVGAGPSGLTAAIYTTRRSLKTLVISKDVGGQASLTDDIENYPGFKHIGGLELMQKFQEQAQESGTEFMFTEVIDVKKDKDIFSIKTLEEKEIKAKSVILSFGLTPRNLEVPGEKELTGKGVSYCATCDGPLYKNKDVAVVGGGNSALDAAEYLSRESNKVYLIHRREEFTGEQVLIDQVNNIKNIELVLNANVKEIKGENTVESLIYKIIDGEEKEINVNGVFIEIGHIAKTDWVEGLVDITNRKEIKITTDCETKTPGLFAAGDITEITYKQVIISAGEGSKAALQAYKYLQGTPALIPDWNK
jgi:thioredoxin reductase (NADPH)